MRLRCGEQPVDLAAGKPRALVALLALQGSRAVSVDTIIDALWGDDPPSTAANAVQVYVSAIRRALRAAGSSDARRALATTGGGYALDVDGESVDALQFEALVHSVATGDAGAGARDIALAALALWQGDRALSDVNEPFADALRIRFDELRAATIERRIDADLALGAAAELVGEIEQLLAAHPYRESLWQRLMIALYRCGRQADALAAFGRARGVLLEELGIDPSPALVALEAAILRQDEQLNAPPAPARVELASPSVAAVAPAAVLGLRSLPGPFIGRQSDFDAVAGLVRDAATRIVTVTGPGGAGKTRLAIAVAESALAGFGFVAFVDLAATTSPAEIVTAVATACGLEPNDDPARAITEWAGSMSMLIVLDNVEQIVGAADPIADLAARIPPLTVLVTSRVPLRLAAEVEHRLGPLEPDDARRIFTGRARALGVDLEIDPAARDAIHRICDRLDRLPLALELAAARVRVLALDALDAHLEHDGFTVLGRGRADTPARHQTLDATIAWSVDLLSDRARRLYEVLGCFVGGATVDAIQYVSALDLVDLLDTLDVLVDASLIPVPDLSGTTPRVQMLETIRTDAAARVARRADADELALRHARCFAEALHAANHVRIDDLPNVRLALRRLIDQRLHDAAADLAVDARNLFFDVGALREAIDWYRGLLALDLAPLARARVAILAGTFSFMVDELDGTEELLIEGVTLLRRTGERDPVAINAFCYLGMFALSRDDAPGADARAVEAVEWARDHDASGHSMALDFRAYVARQAGEHERSAELQAEAVALARQSEPAERLSQRLANLARAYSAIGAEDEARVHAREALDLAIACGSQPSQRDAYVAFGDAVRLTDGATAIGHLAQGALIALELGQRATEEIALLARALVDTDAATAALLAGAAKQRNEVGGRDDAGIVSILESFIDSVDPAEVQRGIVSASSEVKATVVALARPKEQS